MQEKASQAVNNILLTAGLTEKEAAAYEILLRFGSKPTTFVAKHSGLSRGTAYAVLHSLKEKGLVCQAEHQEVQHFAALSPEHLLGLIEHEEQNLRRRALVLQKALPLLGELKAQLSKAPPLRQYFGKLGVGAAILESLRAERPDIHAVISIGKLQTALGEAFLHKWLDGLRETRHEWIIENIDSCSNAGPGISKTLFDILRQNGTMCDPPPNQEALSVNVGILAFDQTLLVLLMEREISAFAIESSPVLGALDALIELRKSRDNAEGNAERPKGSPAR